jgi:hypothetical protein
MYGGNQMASPFDSPVTRGPVTHDGYELMTTNSEASPPWQPAFASVTGPEPRPITFAEQLKIIAQGAERSRRSRSMSPDDSFMNIEYEAACHRIRQGLRRSASWPEEGSELAVYSEILLGDVLCGMTAFCKRLGEKLVQHFNRDGLFARLNFERHDDEGTEGHYTIFVYCAVK